MLYILFSDICPLRNCHVDSISEIFGFQGYVRLAPRFKIQCARTVEAVCEQTMASFTIFSQEVVGTHPHLALAYIYKLDYLR